MAKCPRIQPVFDLPYVSCSASSSTAGWQVRSYLGKCSGTVPKFLPQIIACDNSEFELDKFSPLTATPSTAHQKRSGNRS